MLSVGGGVKFRIAKHALVRFDFRDYMTPFPTRVILPAGGASVSGWPHDLTPMVGISAFSRRDTCRSGGFDRPEQAIFRCFYRTGPRVRIKRPSQTPSADYVRSPFGLSGVFGRLGAVILAVAVLVIAIRQFPEAQEVDAGGAAGAHCCVL